MDEDIIKINLVETAMYLAEQALTLTYRQRFVSIGAVKTK